jgi:hypothetical protein
MPEVVERFLHLHHIRKSGLDIEQRPLVRDL